MHSALRGVLKKRPMLVALGLVALGLAACGGRAELPPWPSDVTSTAQSGGDGYAVQDDGTDAAPAPDLADAGSGRTTAWGKVLDDPSGRPLAGIRVRLQPWDRGCVKTSRTTAKCPKDLRWKAKTNRKGRFVLAHVPNGDYLLIVGSDDSSDLTRPTVHDRVTFTGGTQRLKAPTLPAIPCVDASEVAAGYCGAQAKRGTTPYPRPAAEEHGDYRLTTLDPTTEVPCATEFQLDRTKRGLTPGVVDEWITENAHEDVAYAISTVRKMPVPQPYPFLSSADEESGGGNYCSEMIDAYFDNGGLAMKLAHDPRVLWFGAYYTPPAGDHAGRGNLQAPPDPRVFKDPNGDPWL
jgi:hypothetical protein